MYSLLNAELTRNAINHTLAYPSARGGIAQTLAAIPAVISLLLNLSYDIQSRDRSHYLFAPVMLG